MGCLCSRVLNEILVELRELNVRVNTLHKDNEAVIIHFHHMVQTNTNEKHKITELLKKYQESEKLQSENNTEEQETIIT